MPSQKRRKKRDQDMVFSPTQTAGEKPSGELQEWWEHIRQNPMLYVGAVVFVLIAVLAGVFYRLNAEARQVSASTAYARAIEIEDPSQRAAELQQVVEEAPAGLRGEILYMAGEAALEAGDTEQAVTFFEQVRADHTESEFAAFSVEALGALAEDDGDYQQALELYREVRENWPETLAGRRQAVNIGRIHEQLDNVERARDAYEEQTIVFAGSSAARRAEEALQRLQQRHPDLFEEPIVPDDALDPTVGQPPMPMGEPAPAPDAPAPDMMPMQPDAEPDVIPMQPEADPDAMPIDPEIEIDPEAPPAEDDVPELPEVPEIEFEGMDAVPEPEDGAEDLAPELEDGDEQTEAP